MAASLPWCRDEEPAQLPGLAPHPGGVGPKDHARRFYLRGYRIRAISTINAMRATYLRTAIHRGSGVIGRPESNARSYPALPTRVFRRHQQSSRIVSPGRDGVARWG